MVALASTGSTLGDLRLTVDAPAYDHVYAIVGPWRVVHVGAGGLTDEPLPELPTGLAFADLSPTSSTMVAVFASALTRTDGVAPWEVPTPLGATDSGAQISRRVLVAPTGR